MNDLVAFAFEEQGQKVRTVKIDGQAWFVGIDVCALLGFQNASNAMNYHCRGVEKFYPISDALGRPRDTRILSQADVLRLITNSTLPEAMRIEAWIFEEVIPTVLRTGSYGITRNNLLPGSKRPMLEDSRVKLEELKAKKEKTGAFTDLSLHQFILECLEITGKRYDFVDLDEAYELYCGYAADPLPKDKFSTNVCYANRVIILQTKQNRLTNCKFKPNIDRSL
jgi:prophage antirepressor-like protein